MRLLLEDKSWKQSLRNVTAGTKEGSFAKFTSFTDNFMDCVLQITKNITKNISRVTIFVSRRQAGNIILGEGLNNIALVCIESWKVTIQNYFFAVKTFNVFLHFKNEISLI